MAVKTHSMRLRLFGWLLHVRAARAMDVDQEVAEADEVAEAFTRMTLEDRMTLHVMRGGEIEGFTPTRH